MPTSPIKLQLLVECRVLGPELELLIKRLCTDFCHSAGQSKQTDRTEMKRLLVLARFKKKQT